MIEKLKIEFFKIYECLKLAEENNDIIEGVRILKIILKMSDYFKSKINAEDENIDFQDFWNKYMEEK